MRDLFRIGGLNRLTEIDAIQLIKWWQILLRIARLLPVELTAKSGQSHKWSVIAVDLEPGVKPGSVIYHASGLFSPYIRALIWFNGSNHKL